MGGWVVLQKLVQVKSETGGDIATAAVDDAESQSDCDTDEVDDEDAEVAQLDGYGDIGCQPPPCLEPESPRVCALQHPAWRSGHAMAFLTLKVASGGCTLRFFEAPWESTSWFLLPSRERRRLSPLTSCLAVG